jgi:hypothetical protein
VPGDLAEVLAEVAGEVGLGRLSGGGAVEPGPVGGGERRLDRVAGEGVHER